MEIGKSKTRQQGYTLLAMLILIILIGYTLGEAGAMWSDARRQDREQELLKVGDKIRTAIGQYYNNTPGAVKQYPPSLEALLRDDRFPVPRRYLRQVYKDPMTNRDFWGVMTSPSGGIMGIYSTSYEKPFKTYGFRPRDKSLENKNHYMEWQFFYIPESELIKRL